MYTLTPRPSTELLKLLGLLLGKDQATNKTYVGAGLKLLDDGMTYEKLMSDGLDVVLGANASSLSVVELIWNNLIGHLPQLIILASILLLLIMAAILRPG